MEQEFKVGDLVKMKSGSMTMVVNIVGQNYVECCWWDSAKNDYRKFEFKAHQLVYQPFITE
ncbi:MAG: DUF2158 domain-containing protein [Taibaiella sp.]|nr:DUF2158 domain-containing protein [Taibaiella sp.]